ncbi:hypothetical protein PMAYCL1PPCAC_08646, partial [Pristionchus mayeri]
GKRAELRSSPFTSLLFSHREWFAPPFSSYLRMRISLLLTVTLLVLGYGTDDPDEFNDELIEDSISTGSDDPDPDTCNAKRINGFNELTVRAVVEKKC